MSTLAMALAAAMVIGSAPEKVSEEVEQRLDLRGTWEDTLAIERANGSRVDCQGSLEEGILEVRKGRSAWAVSWACTDRGKGRLEVICWARSLWRGIYKVKEDSVIQCLYRDGDYLTSSRGADEQWLLTLRRVKHRK